MDFFLLLVGTAAAVIAAIFGWQGFQMPFLSHIHCTRYGSGFEVKFTFSTSLMNLEIEAIEIPGFKLRDLNYLVVNAETAEPVIHPDFLSTFEKRERDFGYRAYPLTETPPAPVLHLRLRKWGLRWEIRKALSKMG